MNSLSIRKNDTVRVISGKDKGKTGRVLRVIASDAKVLVEHVGMVKRHLKADQRQKGGVAEKESAISVAKVQLVCKSCGPVRVGHDDNGNRTCKKCGTVLE